MKMKSAELRNDPTVDQERIPEIIRLEMYQLRRERDQLRGLNAELGLEQEIGIER